MAQNIVVPLDSNEHETSFLRRAAKQSYSHGDLV